MSTPISDKHLSALDGLRATCLLAVIFFHSGFEWMVGGFLGVSTFFTLSGFLITSLLLSEFESHGTISIRGFWARRLRRLVPASLIAVGAVVATNPLWLSLAERQRLAGDALATLLYVLNWRFISGEYAYELIFTAPSPFQHFWSLAIEAQFYLIWPVLFVALARAFNKPLWPGMIVVLLAIASVGVGYIGDLAEHAQYRLYYGSDARAAELLVGALLAIVLATRSPGVRWPDRVGALCGPVALGLLLVAWVFVRGDDARLYGGGFALHALLSALVIVAATRSGGIVPRVLSRPVLCWIGKVSYGAYLYHWPVFVVLDVERTGLAAFPLLVVRVVVTFGLAGASYRFVEEPIRRARVLPAPWSGRVMVASVSAIAAAALITSPISVTERSRQLDEFLIATLTPAAPVPGEARFAIFGDSMATTLWMGVVAGFRDHPNVRGVKGATVLGCGLLHEGWYRDRGTWLSASKFCDDVREAWLTSVEEHEPAVAVVLVGAWETRDWRMKPDGRVLGLGDRQLDLIVRDKIGEAMDALMSAGLRVVWLTVPTLTHPRDVPGSRERVEVDPSRIARLNELIRDEADKRSGHVRVVDLASIVNEWPRTRGGRHLRPDGVHFSREAAREVARSGLTGAIIRAGISE